MRPVDHLLRLLRAQNTNKPLINAVNNTIDRSLAKLAGKMGVEPDPKVILAAASDPSGYPITRQRLQLKGLSCPSYQSFVSSLYPLALSKTTPFGRLDSSSSHSINVNHDDVYAAYLALPEPRMAHIQGPHLNRLMEVFLTRRNHVKANALSLDTDFEAMPHDLVVRALRQMLQRRSRHANIYSHLLQDMAAAEVPLTPAEKLHLVYLTFFRDNDKLLRKVHSRMSTCVDLNIKNEYAELKLPRQLDVNTIENLRQRMGNGSETNAVLLSLAIRHRNHEAVQLLAEDVPLLVIPHLLDYYREEGHLAEFDELVRSLSVVDTRTVNAVARNMAPDEAYDFLKQTLVSSSDPLYRRITPTDSATIAEYTRAHEYISTVVQSDPYCVVADIDLFRHVMGGFVQQATYKELAQVFEELDARGIPLTSRDFKGLFRGLKHGRWPLAAWVQIVGRLLDTHDAYYNLSNDELLRANLGRLELPDLVVNFVSLHLSPSSVTPYDGNIVKLLDELMNLTQQALEACVRASQLSPQTEMSLLHEVNDQCEVLKAHVADIRAADQGVARSHMLDEIAYVKKLHLLDVLDRVAIHA